MLEKFNDVFGCKLDKNNRFKNKEAKLTLVENCQELEKPNVGTARSCPYNYRDAADKLIKELEDAGIIKKNFTTTEHNSV